MGLTTSNLYPQILQSLPPDVQALVDSGKVRIVITGFSAGSVVVNFAIVFVPNASQDIMEVSHSVMASLQNSSRYTVDSNGTSVQGRRITVSPGYQPNRSDVSDMLHVWDVLVRACDIEAAPGLSFPDLDECLSGDVDCSSEAECVNTWGGYDCACSDGFMDANPSRPGRSCMGAVYSSPSLSS